MNKCIKTLVTDYDPIFSSESCNKKVDPNNDTGDLYQLSSKFYDLINIKLALLLFITYYILNTDIFIEKGLSRMFCNVYDSTHDKFTDKGIIISGIILSMCYILYDFLDKKNII